MLFVLAAHAGDRSRKRRSSIPPSSTNRNTTASGPLRGRRRRRGVRLWSRLGNEKTSQFPEIAAALGDWAKRRREPVVLDGEIVALDADGRAGRLPEAAGPHSREATTRSPSAGEDRVHRCSTCFATATAICANEPLTARRAVPRIAVRRKTGSPLLRISEQVAGDGRALYERALASGWEGLIAKHAASKYRVGQTLARTGAS